MKNLRSEKIFSSIIDVVGNTPMVRLNRVPKDNGIECEFLGKCEFLNPGGSSKDKVALEMFLQAEAKGIIKPGDTMVEASSGNAGIGLALMAACKGYKMVVTIPEKMSNEKISVLKSLGAEIIRTPTEKTGLQEGSCIMVARKIQKERPGSHILDQCFNQNNPAAHYKYTGQEIFDQTGGKLDYIFIGTGTGGTATGVSRKLKELIPHIKVIGVDPIGSILAQPEELNHTENKTNFVEGMGASFIPATCDRSVIDGWVKAQDLESLKLARELISKEGLLCGASSGYVLQGAFKYLRENKLDKKADLRCVIILPDSIRNYLSKFCSDEWMVKNGLLDPNVLEIANHPLKGKTIESLEVSPIPHYDDRLTISDCLDAFARGELAVPLIHEGQVKAIVTRESILHGMMKKNLTNYNSASNATTKEAVIVGYNTDLSAIDALLKTEEVVFVQKLNENGKIQSLFGVTKLDLIKVIRKETKELL